MAQKLIDETGNKYGNLTVLYKTKDKNNRTAWMCKCDCGNETDVIGGDLRSGRTMSCGCYSRDIASKRNFKDEVGNKFGRLTVIELIQKSPKAV